MLACPSLSQSIRWSLNIFQSDAAERKAGSTSRRLLNPAKKSAHLLHKAQGHHRDGVYGLCQWDWGGHGSHQEKIWELQSTWPRKGFHDKSKKTEKF
uniref:Uncharacterized protein n=1 Tax=Cyanoderma ruficeps TaxID=181631 RepID=A0A8C3QU55_9PASS